MAIPEFTKVDYLTQARERYPYYLQDKDVFDRYVQLLLKMSDDLSECLRALKQDRWLDTAVGKQLDVIGALVGQSRETIPSFAKVGFGFKGAEGALGFGTLSNTAIGGYFASITDGQEGTVMDDDIYRLFIKSRILYNSSRCTIPEMLEALDILIGEDFGFITQQKNARITINIGKTLSPLEKYIIKGTNTKRGLIPIPIGVAVDFVNYRKGKAFGFLGHPEALGFGTLEETVTTSGGYGEDYGQSYGKLTPSSQPNLTGGYFASLF